MTKKPVVAILGATGAVGQEFIRLIEERNFPYSQLKLLASYRSAGKKMTVNGQEYTIEEAKPESFDGVDIGLFAGGSISKELGPEAAKRGCVVIDNSSTFRMDPEVPLVVPEVNPEDIAWHKNIIANPNCSTIIMLMALKPIHDLSPIKKIVVSTYQAVSGAGKEGIDELKEETEAYLKGEEMQPKILPSKSLPKHYPIAFNLIPQIDKFLDNDYTKEEMKMVNETHKMLHDDSIAITATTVRVPVFRSHAESIMVETADELDVEAVRKAINAFLVHRCRIIRQKWNILCLSIRRKNMTATSAVFVKTCIIRRPSTSGFPATRSVKGPHSMPCRLLNTCWPMI